MRSRLRWGEEMWNKNVDQCALAMYVAKEARQDARVSPEMIDNMLQGFMGGLLVSWIICQFLWAFCFVFYAMFCEFASLNQGLWPRLGCALDCQTFSLLCRDDIDVPGFHIETIAQSFWGSRVGPRFSRSGWRRGQYIFHCIYLLMFYISLARSSWNALSTTWSQRPYRMISRKQWPSTCVSTRPFKPYQKHVCHVL